MKIESSKKLGDVLKEYKEKNTDNKYITLVTENEYSTYEVFSVYQIEAEDYYLKMQFKDDEFESFETLFDHEFVFDEDERVTEWAKNIIVK